MRSLARGVSLRKIHRSIANILLGILTCMIVVIGSIAIVGAYWNHKATNFRIETQLKKIEEVSKRPRDAERLRHFVEETKTLCEDTADNGTMTFLFTVFSIALVSAGAYLVERMRGDIALIEEKLDIVEASSEAAKKKAGQAANQAQKAGEDVDVNSFRGAMLLGLARDFSSAREMSWRLRNFKKGLAFEAAIPGGLDAVRCIQEKLEELSREGIGITQTLTCAFLRDSGEMITNFDILPKNSQAKVAHIIERLKEINKLLM